MVSSEERGNQFQKATHRTELKTEQFSSLVVSSSSSRYNWIVGASRGRRSLPTGFERGVPGSSPSRQRSLFFISQRMERDRTSRRVSSWTLRIKSSCLFNEDMISVSQRNRRETYFVLQPQSHITEYW